ncbi:hypothetical protein WDZ92_49865, partial [Nostoc sp. NIES-2111]
GEYYPVPEAGLNATSGTGELQRSIVEALEGAAAVRRFVRSDDWEAGGEEIDGLRSAFDWTVDRLKADLDAALLKAIDAERPR